MNMEKTGTAKCNEQEPVALPPHSVEMEQSVLGALLIDPDAILDVRPILGPEDFYLERNRWVYEAMIALFSRDTPLDFVTLCDELERADRLEEIGGAAYITRLVNQTPTSLHVKHYAERVRDYATRRRLVGAAEKAARLAYDSSLKLDDALRQAETAILDVRRNGSRVIGVDRLMSGLYDLAEMWQANPLQTGEVRGLSTGIGPLDEATGGLETGLYMMASRPSLGKTALALQIAANIARAGGKVLFFSLEMIDDQIAFRLATSHARIEMDRIKRGVATPDEMHQWVEAMGEIASWPLKIITGTMSASQIRAIIQREQMREDVAAVFVDGFWLLTGAKRAETRYLELGALSRELKLAADDLRVPIIVIHQLNRAVESRENKRPLLADLRESGRLEEDADLVLMLHRNGYYDSTAEDANVLEIWIRKNRLGGPAGRCIKLFWEGKFMRCAELEHRIVSL